MIVEKAYLAICAIAYQVAVVPRWQEYILITNSDSNSIAESLTTPALWNAVTSYAEYIERKHVVIAETISIVSWEVSEYPTLDIDSFWVNSQCFSDYHGAINVDIDITVIGDDVFLRDRYA